MGKLGAYWSVMHRRPADYDYFRRLNPTVIKLMDAGPPDYQWVRANLPNALVIARDWALSEQHDDMHRDPTGTGNRHAQEWAQHAPRLGFDRAKTLVLGINEPRVWEPDMLVAVVPYTVAFCDECARLGLRAGALQLGVGWPANTGPDTPPNWRPYAAVEAAIKRGNHALVTHEYWADAGPGDNWGWWAGRTLRCPWDVPIVIGECGIDMYVKDPSVPHHSRGWQGRVSPQRYAQELAEYVGRMSADPRFVGCCVFASDFANREWASFDVEPAYSAILATPIPQPQPGNGGTVHIPVIVGSGPTQPGTTGGAKPQPTRVPTLVHPVADARYRTVTQVFGVNPDYYKRYSVDGVPLKGHNGIDFGTPIGAQIRSVATGQVVEVAEERGGYGRYVKVAHPWGESLYAHLSRQDVVVGQQVYAGQTLGLSGDTGKVTGAHLHFGLRVAPFDRRDGWGGYTDPLPYLAGQAAPPQPAPTADLLPLIESAAAEFGLEWQRVAAQVMAESSFNAAAKSAAGAQGLMQVVPSTWAEWSVKIEAGDNPFDPHQNLRVGCAYMAWLVRTLQGKYGAQAYYMALIAYGWGIGNLTAQKEEPPLTWRFYASNVLFGAEMIKGLARMERDVTMN